MGDFRVPTALLSCALRSGGKTMPIPDSDRALHRNDEGKALDLGSTTS